MIRSPSNSCGGILIIYYNPFFHKTSLMFSMLPYVCYIYYFSAVCFCSGRTEKEMTASEAARSPQPVRRTKSQRQERRRASSATAAASQGQPVSTPSPPSSDRSKGMRC